MKAFVAIDSFKGCISSFEAGGAARDALLECGLTDSDIRLFPVSDGGEGFCSVVSCYLKNASSRSVWVHGPSGDMIEASYLLSEEKTAYLESASACGYTLVPDSMRTPRRTSSFGLGEMMADALAQGAGRIVVGLGGSATCDGGVGMLQALGCRFFSGGELLPDGAPAMFMPLTRMDKSGLKTAGCSFEGWADTLAAFTGESGAVKMYGRQKGLLTEEMDEAERWMASLAQLYGLDEGSEAAGAAGGLGGALKAVLGAGMYSGAEMICSLSGLAGEILACGGEKPLLITGEGRYDSQTLTGKLPFVVAQNAPGARKICLAGQVAADLYGPFDQVLQITPEGMPLDTAMRKDVAVRNLMNSIKSILI